MSRFFNMHELQVHDHCEVSKRNCSLMPNYTLDLRVLPISLFRRCLAGLRMNKSMQIWCWYTRCTDISGRPQHANIVWPYSKDILHALFTNIEQLNGKRKLTGFALRLWFCCSLNATFSLYVVGAIYTSVTGICREVALQNVNTPSRRRIPL